MVTAVRVCTQGMQSLCPSFPQHKATQTHLEEPRNVIFFNMILCGLMLGKGGVERLHTLSTCSHCCDHALEQVWHSVLPCLASIYICLRLCKHACSTAARHGFGQPQQMLLHLGRAGSKLPLSLLCPATGSPSMLTHGSAQQASAAGYARRQDISPGAARWN